MTITEAIRRLGRLPVRLESEMAALARQIGREGVEIARVYSSGRVSLARLREMGHPYSRRRPGPIPYGDPGIINQQTGAFKRGWHAVAITGGPALAAVQVRNDTPEADYLKNGTDRMIRRPIDAKIESVLSAGAERQVAGVLARLEKSTI